MKEIEVRKPDKNTPFKLVGNLGVGGERGLVFMTDGICPCQSATQYKDPIKVVVYDRKDD